ncbi:site-specific integrase [Siminovitchia sp. FSL W7-1587]|uniref:tyrosine-type recombinase/integrase n=1 Tax=Siminovitchia sp. FSL W7-1587 TaxID=2954699 RepID=UPI0030CCE4F9
MIHLVDDFLEWIISEGLLPSNLPYFRSRFYEFADFCETHNITVDCLNVEVSRLYMANLAQRPNKQKEGQRLSTSTRAKHYDFLIHLGNFLGEKGLIDDPDITKGIRRPVPRHTTIQSFTPEQLQAIFDAIRNVRATPQYKERFVLLLYTLVSTGLRISEALELQPISFDFERRRLLVIGKGNKEREVPFSFDFSKTVQDYITKYEIDRTEYIFASRYGRPLSPSSVRDALRKVKNSLGTKHGIDRMRVSPHTFRHTFARLWVAKGGNTIALSRILGHTSTQMTDKYVRLWGVDLNQAYDLCDPCSDITVPKFDQ